MLSAGFANLTYLKSRLLPDAATDDTEWDKDLAAIGKGVAGKFDRHCVRRFARDTDAQDIFAARGAAWVLLNYPVEAIASVEVVDTDGQADELDDGEWMLDEGSGLLETRSLAGDRTQKLRVTYAGGYWLDPRDGTAAPAEATPLPDDLLEAWVLQCQHEAESRGILGAKSFRKQNDESAPKTVDAGLIEGVTMALAPYRRFGGI